MKKTKKKKHHDHHVNDSHAVKKPWTLQDMSLFKRPAKNQGQLKLKIMKKSNVHKNITKSGVRIKRP